METLTGPHDLIDQLGLAPHPEGGWYRETQRSAQVVETTYGPRSAITAINFLLTAGQISQLHHLRQEETWIYRAGPGLRLHVFAADGLVRLHELRPGAPLQATVPAGAWMGAEVPDGWALVECVCMPGFDSADLAFATGEEMLSGWPAHTDLVQRLTLT